MPLRHWGGVGVYRYNSILFLTWALDAGRWSMRHPSHFTTPPPSRERDWNPFYRDWVGLRASLDGCKKSCPTHAPTEEKSGNEKQSFNEELEQVFEQFLMHHMKIVLGDFNAKLGREYIFTLTTGNEILHENSSCLVVD
jgi:hypothetical protein